MLKRTVTIIVLLVSAALMGTTLPSEIINGPKPLKGGWDFQLKKQWSITEAGDYVLISSDNIRIDDNGDIYLFDNKHFKFFVFSPDGKLLKTFGKRGEGPGEVKHMGNFILMEDTLIVSDSGKIHYFSKNGTYIRSFNPGLRIFPRTFLNKNRFLMVTSEQDKKSETEKMELMDTETGKRTLIHKIEKEKDLVASSGGMVLRFKDTNTTPMLVATANNNSLIFAKNDSYQFKKTDLKGNVTDFFSVKDVKRRKITEDTKRKRFENIQVNGSKLPEDMLKKMIKSMPDFCTYFSSIRVDDSDLIYVYLNDITNRDSQELDIFSPDGKYLYHAKITLPDNLITVSPMIIKGNWLVVFVEDQEGERELIKFKITKPSA